MLEFAEINEIRAHLRIVEMNNTGVFLDPEEKEFCKRGGLILLARGGFRWEIHEQGS